MVEAHQTCNAYDASNYENSGRTGGPINSKSIGFTTRFYTKKWAEKHTEVAKDGSQNSA